MVKIIYFDIDGTLRDEVNEVSEKTRYAIDQCREQNIKRIICTGRNPKSIQDDIKTLPMDGLISGGGCYIEYNGLTLYERYFERKIIEKIIKISSDKDLSLSLEAKNRIYMDSSAAEFYKKDFNRKFAAHGSEFIRTMYKRHKISFEDNISSLKDDVSYIHKICIIGQRKITDYIPENLKNALQIVQEKIWNEKYYIEFLPKNCNKGTAIEYLNLRLNITKDNAMCFGDSENDIDMMKATGIAVAMAGCSKKLEKYASSVCETADKDGIYNELVRRKIIKPQTDERRESNEKTVVAV